MKIPGEIPHEGRGIMTTDEMRFWIRELLNEPAYGWREYAGNAALGELFYPGKRARGTTSLRTKLKFSWIYLSERGHFHRTIMACLAGKVVFDPATRKAKWVETPVPVKRVRNYMQLHMTARGIKLTPGMTTHAHYTPAMPKFGDIFGAAYVRPDKKKAPPQKR